MYNIEYKGKTLKTKLYTESSEEEMQQAKEEYYKKPDFDTVLKQMKKISIDGVQNDKITRYYFRELMSLVQIKTAKWCVADVFECKDLFSVFKAKVLNSPQVFDPNENLSYNIMRAIALGGKSYAKNPTNFPIKAADEILNKYNINNNWLDFSCGWGARLTAALKHKINYYGIDPNDKLVLKLNELTNDWHTNIANNSLVDIRTQGSEIFIPEWEGKMGLAFSSPPYFDLEDYKIGDQSYKEGINFDDWLNNYLYPTFNNIYKYLIDDGILALNIKNIDKYPLVDICISYLENHNFIYIETRTLKNIKRLKSTGGLLDKADEGIYIFKKVIK